VEILGGVLRGIDLGKIKGLGSEENLFVEDQGGGGGLPKGGNSIGIMTKNPPDKIRKDRSAHLEGEMTKGAIQLGHGCLIQGNSRHL
jgi:hypothetical protein